MRTGGVVLVVASVCVCARIDELLRARCTAACVGQPNKNKCEAECSLLKQIKPGECPSRDSMIWYERACLQSCSQDTDCPGTDKCCVHECGATCQHAVALDKDPGLPSVPANLTVTDGQGKRSRLVRWSPSVPSTRVYYVVQERSHPGSHLQPQLFGPWRTRCRRRRSRYQLEGLTPAHWYQVRVAAVNPNGSRGYSPPSQAFTLKIDPSRPGEPENLTVSREGWVNGRLWAELSWKRPPSDLPLHHYKVFWSHCVKSEVQEDPNSTFCKPKSVMVNHKTVNYKSTNFILRDLEPHSLYFIQVQAITIPYGTKKISSHKAGTFINTNKQENATYDWRLQPQNIVTELRILNFYRSTSDKFSARVEWKASPGRFLVSWAPTVACGGAKNNPTYSAIAEGLQYYIDHLAVNCKYQVVVTAVSSSKSAKVIFTTPLRSEVTTKIPSS